jgi:hypothetical protein
MLKLEEIVRAWVASADPSPEQKNIADRRLNICKGCEYLKFDENVTALYYCGKCFCPITKKIYSPLPEGKACPEGKWDI